MKIPMLLVCSLGIAMMAIPVGPAFSQSQIPPENHYKTYEVISAAPIVLTVNMVLTDQFGVETIDEITLEKFAMPAEKNGEPTEGDPRVHHTWYRLFHPEPVRRVSVVDQFGPYSWRLRDAWYLLVPAEKGTGDIPVANHYKCYEAEGPTKNIDVILKDQVDSLTVTVLEGKLFCNPVEKDVAGVVYPIVDTLAHLTCYDVVNTVPYDFQESVIDQFDSWVLNLGDNLCLCLPAYKDEDSVVPGEATSWGRIKALYSN